MATTLKKIDISITTEVDVPELKVNRIILTNSVGSLPVAHLFTQPKESNSALTRSTNLDWDAITNITQEMQAAAFNVASESSPDGDIQINIEDVALWGGDSTQLNFSGFMTSPGFSIMSGMVSSPLRVLHSDIQLQAFDPRIYQTVFYGSRTSGSSALFQFSMADPISITVKKMLEYVTKDPVRLLDGLDETDAALSDRHDINAKHLPRVLKFLDNSLKTVIQVDGVAKDYSLAKAATLDSTVIGSVKSSIFSMPNFGAAAMGPILDTFLFQFTAQFDGGAKWEHRQNFGEPEGSRSTISVPIQSIDFNLSGMNHLPLSQVLLQSNAEIRRQEKISNVGTNPATHMLEDVVGRYPKAAAPEGGRVMGLPAPNFLKADFINEQTDFVQDEYRKRDFEKHAAADNEAVEAQAKDTSTKLARFLDTWAEKWYKVLVLEGSMATVRIPLDLRFGTADKPVGQVYTVEAVGESEGSKELYTGYLQTVSHEIALLPAEQSQAYTTLVFNHVRSKGFELPTA